MARILHMADMHFDSAFTSNLSINKSKLRRSEQREVFSRIIEMVKTEQIDVMLISGDLFDSENVSEETINFMVRKFAEISEIPVLIAAGNHDPFNMNSVYERISLGDNVHIFNIEGGFYDFENLNLRVSGVSFGSEDGSNIKTPKTLHPEFSNILVMHGNVVSGTAESGIRYNPVTKQEIENSGFDYIAFGHVHSFSGINVEGRTYWAYPGIPEPRGFDESGERGVVIGNVLKAGSEFNLRKVLKRNYHTLEIEITADISDNEQIIELIDSKIKEYGNQNIFRIILIGKLRSDFFIDIDLLKSRTEKLGFFVEIKDETEMEYDLSVDIQDNSLRAEYIRLMQKKLDEFVHGTREYRIIENAVKYGLDAIEGRLKP